MFFQKVLGSIPALRWRWLRFLAPLAVLIAGAVIGAHILFWQNGPDCFVEQTHCSSTIFGPAVMWAFGEGYFEPDPAASPALTRFLKQETPALHRNELPSEIPRGFLNRFCQDHLYLFGTIGTVWRIFGVSWTVYKCLLIFVFCVTAAIVYGLFRLGMNRLFSVAGTLIFLLTPAVQQQLPNFRDFSKGPFVLGALLILGLLAKKPFRVWNFWLLSALLGAIIGVGIGFREDVLICILPALTVLPLCAARPRGFSIVQRAVAVVLMFACFMGAYWPLRSEEPDEDSQTFHHLLMGTATETANQLGIERASFESVYLQHDVFACAVADSFMRRNHPDQKVSVSLEPEKRALYLEIIKTIPANALIRCYGAVLWLFRNFLTPHDWLWLPLVIFTLAALSAVNARQAWAAFFLLLFSGYVGLQFQTRHCFHLLVVPYWALGFTLDKLGNFGFWILDFGFLRLRSHLRGNDAEKPIQNLKSKMQNLKVRRVLAFAMCAALLLLAPLYAARAYQYFQIEKYAAQCARADLEPVPCQEGPLGDWTLFRAQNPPGCFRYDPEQFGRFLPDYYVAEFTSSPEDRCFVLRYEMGVGSHDFSMALPLGVTGHDTTTTVKYFFPVYDTYGTQDNWPWARFLGIALPRERAAEFKGLYRVRNASDFPLWLNLSLPAEHGCFRHFEQLTGSSRPITRCYTFIHGDPFFLATRAKMQMDMGKPDEAIKIVEDALGVNPTSMCLFVWMTRAYEQKGDIDAAVRTCLRAIGVDPDFYAIYGELDNVLRQRNDPDARVKAWRSLTETKPDSPYAFRYLGLALEATHDKDGAVQAYRNAIRVWPCAPAVQIKLGELLAAKGDSNGAIQVYKAALETDPKNQALMGNLAVTCEAAGYLDETIELYRQMTDALPGYPENAARLDSVLLKQGETARRVAAWQALAAAHPDKSLPHYYLGRALESAGEFDQALAAFRKAIRLNPTDAAARIFMAGLIATMGDIDTAVKEGMKGVALRPDYAITASGLLANAADRFLKSGDKRKAWTAYRAAMDLDAHNSFLPTTVGDLLKEKGDIKGAKEAYRTAVRRQPTYWTACQDLDEAMASSEDADARLATWREVTTAFPDAGEPYYFLGLALEAVRKRADALVAFAKGLDTAKDDANLIFQTGNSLLGMHEYETALASLQRAAETPQYAHDAPPRIAAALCELKRYDEAWREVALCRSIQAEVPAAVLKKLKQDTGRTE